MCFRGQSRGNVGQIECRKHRGARSDHSVNMVCDTKKNCKRLGVRS